MEGTKNAPNLTRRNVLKGIGAFAGLAASGGVVGTELSVASAVINKMRQSSNLPPAPLPAPITPKPEPAKISVPPPEITNASSPFFEHLKDPYDQKDALRITREGLVALSKAEQNNFAISKGKTLQWEKMVKKIIALNEFKFSPDFRIADAMLGLMFVESRGNKMAGAERLVDGEKNPALGVCQIRVKSAEDIAKKEERPFRTYDLLEKPEENIYLALRHMEEMVRLFKDKGIAAWAYHFGEGHMVDALTLYAKAGKGEAEKKEIDEMLSNPDPLNPGSAALVEKYNINFVKLIQHPSVKSYIKSMGDSDQTDTYVPKIAAATHVLKA